ncbi:MAG: hypothetical protein WAM58_21700 [Candidatus Acidiferrum sp.]
MVDTQTNEQAKLEELRAKRNLLFERFAKHPSNIHLAIEIKSIDDQIAESVFNLIAAGKGSTRISESPRKMYKSEQHEQATNLKICQ